MKSYKYILEGLDCANCAKKIEDKIANTKGYEQVNVNFSTLKLSFQTDKEDNVKQEITQIVHSLEPEVNVIDEKEKITENSERNNSDIFRLIIGVIIYVLGAYVSIFSNFVIITTIISLIILLSKTAKKAFTQVFKNKVLDENTLITISVIGACLVGKSMEGVMVIVLYEIGKILEARAVNKTRKSISDLMDIKPEYANLKNGEEVNKVTPEEVKIGDIILIKTGEKIPLDGEVISGEAEIDNSALTGESALIKVEKNSKVLSGGINVQGLLEVKVEKTYENSTVSQILNLVENATDKKAKTETFVSKAAKIYTPIVLGLAVLVAIFMPMLFKNVTYSQSIYKALIFLVISCPCALVISIPLCYFSSIGTCSRRGILVKGSNYIETLNKVENVVFDKTGTITKGVFNVVKVVPMVEEVTEERLLNILIHAEYYSNHPIGISIVDNFGRDKIFPEIITDFQDITGGAKATINGNKILIGNDKLMNANKIELPQIESCNLVVHIVKNKIYQGYVEIGDVIKEEALTTIKYLHKYGKKCFMLTGDSVAIASSVAKQIDVDGYHAELLPHQKVEILEEIKKQSVGKTIFIGDGINDAPVIASADIGIAMGNTGSDATIAIADMVIMGDNLLKINEAFKIAKYTRKKVIQNIILSLTVKFIVMILAILLGFFVTKDGEKMELPLGIAIFSDVGISLLAILNSLLIMRLYHNKKDLKEEQTNAKR